MKHRVILCCSNAGKILMHHEVSKTIHISFQTLRITKDNSTIIFDFMIEARIFVRMRANSEIALLIRPSSEISDNRFFAAPFLPEIK